MPDPAPIDAGVPPEPPPPSSPGPPPPSAQQRADRARMRTVAVVLVGLAVGVLAWIGRTHLVGALGGLVTSASAWLVVPFVLGALMRTRRGAIAAGLSSALLALGGCAAMAAVRGYGLGGSLAVFWAVCSVVGGPLLGAAGQAARRGHEPVRGLGAATIAAAFIAEGMWRYLHELHAVASAVAWLAVGAAIAVALLRRPQRIRWLALTLPLALAADVALTQIHR